LLFHFQHNKNSRILPQLQQKCEAMLTVACVNYPKRITLHTHLSY
jgi:hypothetical protein